MRPVIYATIGVLLLMLAAVGMQQSTRHRVDAEARERARAQDQLDQLITAWESAVDEHVRFWLQGLGSGDTQTGDLERHWRTQFPWVDAVYLWEPGDVIWPAEPFPENMSAIQSNPCIARAMAATGAEDSMQTAERYATCRSGGGRPMALYSTSQTAELLLEADHPDLADQTIRDLGTLPAMAIGESWNYGVNARRLVELRLQHARAQHAMGREDIADHWLCGMKQELLTLNAPTLQSVVDLYTQNIRPQLLLASAQNSTEPCIAALGLNPAQAVGALGSGGLGTDDILEARGLRRLAAWNMVRDQDWMNADIPTLTEGPKLVIDPTTDPPAILYAARLEVGNLLGGIQIDQDELIRTLFRNAGTLGPYLSIRDSEGAVLAGTDEPIFVYRSFGHILPFLQVGIAEGAIPTIATNGALYVQWAVIGIGMMVGVFALVTLVRTDREQLDILVRQREFMTRVTHELKTPLAGIRVIAENLEMGAYRDTEQVEKYARTIIAEAERLGLRVDEVLKAANGPAREDARALDLARVLDELVSTWRERYSVTGEGTTGESATIHCEAPQSLPMHGRVGILRDALTNLLDNALKYQHADRPLVVRVRARVQGRFVVVEVEDNGLGVPANMRKAIFEKFRRVEGPGRGMSGGHGLGLSFVAEAASAHGGTIECKENRSGGSTFVMRVKRA